MLILSKPQPIDLQQAFVDAEANFAGRLQVDVTDTYLTYEEAMKLPLQAVVYLFGLASTLTAGQWAIRKMQNVFLLGRAQVFVREASTQEVDDDCKRLGRKLPLSYADEKEGRPGQLAVVFVDDKSKKRSYWYEGPRRLTRVLWNIRSQVVATYPSKDIVAEMQQAILASPAEADAEPWDFWFTFWTTPGRLHSGCQTTVPTEPPGIVGLLQYDAEQKRMQLKHEDGTEMSVAPFEDVSVHLW